MENAESRAGYGPVDRDRELAEIMAEYEAGLLRYAIRLVNDHSAAQDVVQDVFIKLYRGWKDGAHPDQNLKSWLYRVTHNAAVDHIRRESRLRLLHERQAEDAPSASPAGQRRQLDAKEGMRLALQHLKQLNPAEQQVVLLRLQEGMSYREIAGITRRTEGNVGCVLHHALKKLSASLRQAGITTGGGE
mgnify:CR=1 FL=1